MTTTFETARVGDRVWSIEHGWGVVKRLERMFTNPMLVEFSGEVYVTYKLDGAQHSRHSQCRTQTLFWDEVKFEAPQKPLPDLEVDTKVLVWGDNNNIKHRRHFSHFRDGRIWTFDSGSTSFTKLHRNYVTGWPHWELAE